MVASYNNNCLKSAEPSPVTGLIAVPINPESIMLTWDLPEYPNGPLSGYKIYYKRSNVVTSPPGSDNNGYEVNTTPSGTDPEYNISGLDPSTNYSIFVLAIGIPQLTGRVGDGILVLTKCGMQIKNLL